MKSQKQPLVTVIMTAYNASRYIAEAIESILNQSYKNLEVLIVDDGSTDTTYELAGKYMDQDKRVHVYTLKRNAGPSLASNFALKKAHGEYIARMDADDISGSDRIEKQVEFMQKNPDVVIVGGQAVLIDEKGAKFGEKKYPLSHKSIQASLFTMNPILHPACMIRRNSIPKAKLIYHNHSVLAHDYELLFQVYSYGKLANLPDVIMKYRQHRDSLSLHNPKATFAATCNIRRKAMSDYGFVPTVKDWVIHYMQIGIVRILPNEFVYPLFILIRTGRSILKEMIEHSIRFDRLVKSVALKYIY